MNFFPENFNKDSSIVTVIAGRGEYPQLLVERMRKRDISCRLISLKGETDASLIESFPEDHHLAIHIGQIGKMLKSLKHFQSTHTILAGQIKPLRLFRDFKPDLRALYLLHKLKERNAETLFGTVCSQIEKIGIHVLDARCFMEEDIVVPEEQFPLKQSAVEHGVRIALEVARLNIGQSVVVKNGTVLCVEGFDGTNEMLKHCQNFELDDMLFVKTSKPHHDFRFDVPVFGMKTLELLDKANIRYAALEGYKTIILNKKNVEIKAKQYGIKIFGY